MNSSMLKLRFIDNIKKHLNRDTKVQSIARADLFLLIHLTTSVFQIDGMILTKLLGILKNITGVYFTKLPTKLYVKSVVIKML